MRAVFVSDVNPDRGHIYGLRISSFARAMARRGHQIVILCPAKLSSNNAQPQCSLAEKLAKHDWSEPLRLTAQPANHRLLAATRNPGLPAIVRRPVTGYLFAFEGGVDGDWEQGARPLAKTLAKEFAPEIVWTVFGNSSTLVAGQKLARQANCPWLMDIKDNWESYVPTLLRTTMRRRFADASGFTTNAEVHGDIASRWLPHQKLVLYSGVADVMVAPSDSKARSDKFVLALVGSVYREEMLAGFSSALSNWLSTLPTIDRDKVTLHYAGTAHEMVRKVFSATPPGCAYRIDSNLPHAELAKLCQSAAANCYLWLPQTFHHKMLELLTTRRPVISFPGEHKESVNIASQVGGELVPCTNETELNSAFDTIWNRWIGGDFSGTQVDVNQVTWDAGAEQLEQFFLDVT